jgi:hypothetical protein
MRVDIYSKAFQGLFKKAGIVSEKLENGQFVLKHGFSLTLFQGVRHTFAYQYLLSRINGDCACP